MSGRAAQAAAQSDPEFNTQWKRWLPDGATGPIVNGVRAWHDWDVRAPQTTSVRRAAEREWAKVTGSIAP